MNSRLIGLTALTVLLAACGGGGGSTSSASVGGGDTDTPAQGTGPVLGLELPDNFSVLSAKQDGAGAGSGKVQGSAKASFSATMAFGGQSLKAFDDTDTEYTTDETHTYVYDPSMESLGTINEILCYMGQTAASQMVNQGAYIALVNEERCRQGQNGSNVGQTGQSSGGDTESFARWIVESERTDNDSPQRVRLWVPNSDGGGEQDDPMRERFILVDMTVTEGKSASKPFGSFVLNFKGITDGTPFGGPAEAEVMKGMMATVDNDSDSPQFRFINLGGDALHPERDVGFSFAQSANVRLADADGNSGLALTRTAETWRFDDGFGEQEGSRQETFAIDYDTEHFLASRDDDGDEAGDELICRAREEFDTRVWRYNLYHAADGEFRGRQVTGGRRVRLNSGFPFSYDSDDDGTADAHGWIGYHGLWTEANEALDDGQTIQRYDYATQETSDYTVRVAPGRLIRRTANQESLSAFVGDEFQFWGEHPTLHVFGQWLVTIDENLGFKLLSAVEFGENGPTYSDAVDDDHNPQTADVPVAADFALQDNEVLWLWSEALGGNIVYTHDVSIAAAERAITFFAEEFVDARDSALFPAGVTEQTLYCYDRCLEGGLTQADVDAAQGPFGLFHEYQGQAYTYTLAVADGKVVLTDDANGQPVSATELELPLGNEWGINTGEMLTEPLADATRPWLAFEQDVSYRWETGPNPWNRMVTATDASGTVAEFDRPLEIAYVHSLANDANGSAELHGKRFLLQYGGPGDLHGFPWVREGDSDRWHAAVTLADGVVLTSGGNSFVVKALEKEQSMREVDVSDCAGLDAEAAYADTGLALPGASDIGSVSFTLADKPNVTSAPAVIEGEVQIDLD